MLNIKEIAQALKLKMQDPDDGRFDIGEFAEALISAYKAELLKEVGEPVAQADGYFNHACELGELLYTSDQVAAAIAKATKPLIEERDRAVKRMEAGWIEVCDSGILAFKEMNDELRTQLTAAQEEIERLKSQKPSKYDGYAIGYFDACGVDAWRMTTKDLDQAIDAAIAQGEK